MPHSYNRTSFRSTVDPTNPLIAIYATLVEIELALKDMEFAISGSWRQGHKLIDWIAALGEASAAESLRDELANLVCTDRAGQQARVEANKYPDLRYLQHAQDFPGGSDDQKLQTVLAVVSTTRALLRTRGVNLQ
jgi:hypothetical protein